MYRQELKSLSMSKRIMNKVFCCATDCNVKIYHQGTDSIHLNHNDVDEQLLKGAKTNVIKSGTHRIGVIPCRLPRFRKELW